MIESRGVYDVGACLPELPLQHLRVTEAMQARLKTMSKKEVEALLHLAKYLIFNCPDWHKTRLGVSQNLDDVKKCPGTRSWGRRILGSKAK